VANITRTTTLRSLCIVVLTLAIAHVASLAFPSAASAQSESASVSGRITDQTNAIVPDVEVELRNADTGVTQVTKTNGEGFYAFPYVKPGNYIMSVRKESFRTVSVTGMILNVQDNLSRNFVLQLGSSAESITVNGDTLNINTQSAAVSTLVDRNFVESIPLNGRSLQPLITLTPGVVLTPSSYNNAGQFSVNGQRADANYFIVDGVGANFGANSSGTGPVGQTPGGTVAGTNAFGGTSSLVSIDAIQEFRIDTSSYAPEFGRTPGGQISIATRSGTNEFHGDVFDYFRNTVFDANDWFADESHLAKAPEHQNDFGGVFGGPILKDNTFFFFSYEGLRLLQPTTGEMTVPTTAFRQQDTPVALQPILNALPIANGTDFGNGTAQFIASFSNPTTLDATSIRIDHRLNRDITIFGRYNYAPSYTATRASGALSSESSISLSTQTATFGSTQIITSTLSNDTRLNFSTNKLSGQDTMDNFGGAVPLSDSQVFPAPYSSKNAALFVYIGGLGQAIVDGHISGNSQTQFNVVDTVALSQKSHQFKFGVDFRRLTPTVDPYLYDQFLGFYGGLSQVTAGTPSAFISADDKVGIVFQNLSLYAQDTWKLSPRLTLTYGLRWELNPALHGSDGTPLYPVENVNNPPAVALGPAGAPLYKTTYGNFAPRVGLAAQLSKTRGFERVIRGGFGIFYDLGVGSLGNAGVYFPYAHFKSLGETPYPIPAGQSAPPPFSTTPKGASTYAADPNLALPRTYEWNVAVEQSLGSNQSLRVTYLGAVGRDLLKQQDYLHPNASFASLAVTFNTATSDYNALQLQYQRHMSHGLEILGFYSWSHCIDDVSSDSIAIDSDPRIDRGNCDFDIRHSFHGVLTYNIPTPNTSSLGRAMLGGWSADAIVAAQSAPPVDLNTGVSVLSPTEFITTRPDVVSGIPLYLYGSSCEAANGGIPCPGGKAINFIPGAVAGGCPDGSQSIGPFCPSPAGQQGNLGRNVLRGFGLTQIDFALRRQFNFTERWNLLFSAEFFNILNHPNFGTASIDACTCDSPGTFGLATQMFGRSLSQTGLSGFSPLYQVGGPRSVQLALKLRF
jgi:hypothetical protein